MLRAVRLLAAHAVATSLDLPEAAALKEEFIREIGISLTYSSFLRELPNMRTNELLTLLKFLENSSAEVLL